LLQDYANSKNVLMGLSGETYSTSHDANRAMNINTEEVSDAEEQEDPLALTFPEIKAEPEVSCMCTVRQLTQICRNAACFSDLHLRLCTWQLHCTVD
jgi:hypothetical protein